MIRFLKGGGVRKLFAAEDRSMFGAVPRRATRIEIVPEGPNRGLFYIDCSPLGPEYQFCLTELFEDYKAAVRREEEWLTANWILYEE